MDQLTCCVVVFPGEMASIADEWPSTVCADATNTVSSRGSLTSTVSKSVLHRGKTCVSDHNFACLSVESSKSSEKVVCSRQWPTEADGAHNSTSASVIKSNSDY